MPLKEQSLEKDREKVQHQRTQLPKKSIKVSYVPGSKIKRPRTCLYQLSAEIDANKRKPSTRPQNSQVSNRVPVVVITDDGDKGSSSCRQTRKNQEAEISGDVRLSGTLHNPIDCDPPAGSSPENLIDLTFSDDESGLPNANGVQDQELPESPIRCQPISIGLEARGVSEPRFQVVGLDPTPIASVPAAHGQTYDVIVNPPSYADAPLPISSKPSESFAPAMNTSAEGEGSHEPEERLQSAEEGQSARVSAELEKVFRKRDEADILISNAERELPGLKDLQRRWLERRNRLKSKYPGAASKRQDYRDVCKTLERKNAKIQKLVRNLDSHKEKRQKTQDAIDSLTAPDDHGGDRGGNVLEES